jgi:integrase
VAKLYKRDDSPYWWATGYDHRGRRWRASTRTADHAAARIVAKRVERQRLLATSEGPTLRLSDALERLRAHKARAGRADATMSVLAAKGGRLLHELGDDRNLATLALGDADAYVDTRLAAGVSLHTIAKEWGTLRAALRLARRHGLYLRDPIDLWPDALHDVYTPRTRWLTVEEYQQMLLTIPPRRRDHFVVFVHTGVRHSELHALTADDVNTEARAIAIRGTKTAGSTRTVPLSAEAWEVIGPRASKGGRLFADAWGRSALARALKAASKRAGIPKVDSTNDLRRTFATWLLHAGVPEATTIRLLGHTSSAMVRRVYAQHSPELLRKAIDALPRTRARYVTTHPARHRT